ncbi:MAG: hypothetical protein C0P75_011550 [Bacilli bacterium]|jgi:hypothetical protein|uniref:Lipoprotein n=1 Tax=Ureibacillus suwonensis TaxID=313007 RepID=A0ABW0RDY7_9BACL|nr:hypothetical protein [Bacilli bacterium]
MQMIGSVVGIVSAVASLVFWGIFSFDNPYQTPDSEIIGNLFVAAVIPAAFVIIGQFLKPKWFMFVAFLLSLPIGVYFFMTPGIFRGFSLVSAGYFISFLLFLFEKKRGSKVRTFTQ